MANSAFSNIPTRVYIGIDTLTGNFNFQSSQDGYYLRYTGVSNITGTFRTDSNHYIQNASVFTLYQGGAGVIYVTGASGVTVNGYDNTQGQYYAMQIIKAASNIYDTIGGS
jgi:hypothetical protein